MKSSVRNSLERATAGLKRRPEGEVILALHNFLEPDALMKFPECKDFHTAVFAEPKFKLFHRSLQFITFSGSAVGRRDLATWMVKRSLEVGGHQTVDEVWRYLDLKTFQAFQVMLLAGLKLDSDTGHDLGNDLRLIPAHAAPSRYLREIAFPWQFSPGGGGIESLIIKPVTLKRLHIPQDELDHPKWQKPKSVDFSFEPFEDARLLLSLAARRGPQAIATTIVAPDDVPIMGGITYSLHSYRPLRKMSPPLTKIEADAALRLNEKFLGLRKNQKEHLRIPLRKLNAFFAEADLVQAAVDLRTCLEALFLDGNKDGEFGYRLGLRAALFVGKNLEQRRAVRKAIRVAYGAGSEAVHTGKIKKMDQAKNYIDEAAAAAHTALIQLIDNPVVNWQEIEVSGTVSI